LKPWRTERFCIPERDAARFVAQMEEVLRAYCAPPDPDVPLVCMDEAVKELHADAVPPLPMAPGTPLRVDDKYERNGTASLFMFFAPHLGWRRATAREHRTRGDWAQEVRRLLEEDFPDAKRVRLVCDNLNTHHAASLYAAFGAEVAGRLAARLEIVYTPRNGSWRNVAEIELSVLAAECLDRRIAELPVLQGELAAWTTARNTEAATVRWQFTTADARVKLRHLYPQV
jgi:hypothetical protein